MEASDTGKRPRIGIGYTVGMLTVTAATGERKNGYTVWECTCRCGGVIYLDTRRLQRKTVSDCGCGTKTQPGQRDLSGQQFGRLRCIEPTDQRSSCGDVIWRCVCECGKICTASSGQLVSGNKKSCGCLAYPPRKELVGKEFGQLTVVEYAGKRGGMHRWKCRCSCGTETTVGQTLLESGKTRSCGCLKARTITENLKLCDGTSVTILEAYRKRPCRSNRSGCTGVFR